MSEANKYSLAASLAILPYCCGAVEVGGFEWDYEPDPWDYHTGVFQGKTKQETVQKMIQWARDKARMDNVDKTRTKPVVLNLVHSSECRAIRSVIKKEPDAVMVCKWKNANYQTNHIIEMWVLKNDNQA